MHSADSRADDGGKQCKKKNGEWGAEGRIDDTGRWHVRRAGGQGSHQLTAMARADALALAPDGVEIEPGDEVRILPLR